MAAETKLSEEDAALTAHIAQSESDTVETVELAEKKPDSAGTVVVSSAAMKLAEEAFGAGVDSAQIVAHITDTDGDGEISLEELSEQIDNLMHIFHKKNVRKEMMKNPPWRIIDPRYWDWKQINNVCVPLFVLMLLFICSNTRSKRDGIGEVCDIELTVPIGHYAGDEWLNASYQYTFEGHSALAKSHSYVNRTHAFCYKDKNDGLSKWQSPERGWKVFLSLIPFVCVFQGVLGYELSSRYVAPFTLFVTVFLGLYYFEDEGWFVYEDDAGLQKHSNTVEICGLIFLTVLSKMVWTIFDYALNVFSSFMFLRVLELMGVIEAMRIEFNMMCSTPARKVLLILFSFAVMIAVVAPGGSNFLISGSILITMNHNEFPLLADGSSPPERDDYDKKIAAICLFGNGLTSAFNLVGVCIHAIAADILSDDDLLVYDDQCTHFGSGTHRSESERQKCAAKYIGGYFSMMFFIFGIASPFIMAGMFSRAKTWRNLWTELKPDFPILGCCGLLYSTVQLVVSLWIGPELVCLLAAGGSLALFYAWIQVETYGIGMNGLPDFGKRKWATPFAILIALLLVIKLTGLDYILEGGDSDEAAAVLKPTLLKVEYREHSFERHFGYLSSSAVIVVFVALLTPFVTPFYELTEDVKVTDPSIKEKDSEAAMRSQREGRRDVDKILIIDDMLAKDGGLYKKRIYVIVEAFKKAVPEALPVMLSIGSYASIASMMAEFNMTQTIANFLVDLFKSSKVLWTFVAPVIGALGSGLTGSTTTSNFLFGRLQVQTAIDLDLIKKGYNSVWEFAGMQIMGACAGEMVAPLNAVFSTLLLAGRFPEGELMKVCIKVAGLWLLLSCFVSLLFLGPRHFID